jgi:hypothetical protein
MRLRELLLQRILLLQHIYSSVLVIAAAHCTIGDAPHNVLTATNIASKYLLLLELHLIHGKRHVHENKSALRALLFFAFTSVADAVT